MILDFESARHGYKELYPDSPFFDVWIPRDMFASAEMDKSGNLLIGREDDGIYGIALGTSPKIPSTWKNFSIESRGITSLPEGFSVVADWDCYWSPTIEGDLIAPSISSDEKIEKFLKDHAPDSSVFPGNDEILQWVEVHETGELVAVAALCRWESGRVVISSVATHSHHRGRGFGRELMKRCLIAGLALGEKYLCLGVRHQNVSAQKLYQGVGFTLMHNFSYCERR